MAILYVDPNTVHNPATGDVAPAAWGDVIRDDLEALADSPQCSVFHSAAQSINNATFTALAMNSELYDNDAMHSTVSNTSRVTAQKPGRYQCEINAEFATDADGVRALQVRKNGSTVIGEVSGPPNAAGGVTSLLCIEPAILNAGDYVEAIAFHSAGAALNVNVFHFTVTWRSRF